MIVFDVMEAIGFACWSYWRILRTGSYPSSNGGKKVH